MQLSNRIVYVDVLSFKKPYTVHACGGEVCERFSDKITQKTTKIKTTTVIRAYTVEPECQCHHQRSGSSFALESRHQFLSFFLFFLLLSSFNLNDCRVLVVCWNFKRHFDNRKLMLHMLITKQNELTEM